MSEPPAIPAPDDQPLAATHGGLDAAIAHEVNQPLTAILGNAQAARRFISGGEISRNELLAILDDIIRDTKRASEIIRNPQAHCPDPQPRHR